MTTTPKPTPGSHRGITPGAMPGARTGTRRNAYPAPHSRQASSDVRRDPRSYGRVEEDGTVVLITSAGERIIGSWQAGTPEEGLAHYAQRFNDLATEVALLESRLRAHPDDAANIQHAAEDLRAKLDTAAVIGDLDGLNRRLSSLLSTTEDASEEARNRKKERRQQAIARKESLATEAEEIGATSTEWKAAGDRLREILNEWKTIRGIDRATDDALWKRYSRARDSFNRRRGAHFADLDRQRASARRIKEDLVEQARKLQDSTDWAATAGAFRDLMRQWKAAGRASKDADATLWEQFKAAQDHFFDARNAVTQQRNEEYEANAAAKDQLLADYAPRIKPEENLDAARYALHELQAKWEEIGYVPRERVREYDEKISALEEKVARAADEQWRRTDPEVHARAQQFLDRVAEWTARADEADRAGRTREAERARAQATQWQEWADTALRAAGSL